MGWVLLDRDCVTMHSPQITRVLAVVAAVFTTSMVVLRVVAEVAAAQQPRRSLKRAALPNAVGAYSASAPSSSSCLSAHATRCSSKAVSLLVPPCYHRGTVQ